MYKCIKATSVTLKKKTKKQFQQGNFDKEYYCSQKKKLLKLPTKYHFESKELIYIDNEFLEMQFRKEISK